VGEGRPDKKTQCRGKKARSTREIRPRSLRRARTVVRDCAYPIFQEEERQDSKETCYAHYEETCCTYSKETCCGAYSEEANCQESREEKTDKTRTQTANQKTS